jgi:serine/threonine protein kinase
VNETLEFDRTPLKVGTTLCNGLYQIERVVGAGGFALVYLASQGRWGLQVCIKEYYPYGSQRINGLIEAQTPDEARKMVAGRQAFDDEAATLARFKHPGIVRILGSFVENGTAYLVQEMLEGFTLSEGLELAGRMPLPMVLQVAQQLGQALLMVHAAGLVHSDLKPENIFLTKEGRYVLLDFGLTRGFLSVGGAQIGGRGVSMGYAPPEQYIPGSVLTPASDVYSFSATLYTLLTGIAPPDAVSLSQGQPIPAIKPLNASITAQVENTLLEALTINPKNRIPGIREFLHRLGLDSTPKAISYRPPALAAINSTQAHQGGVTAMALHSGTSRLYTASRTGSIKAWSWPELELLAESNPREHHITSLGVSHNGKYLAIGSDTGEVAIMPADLQNPGIVMHQEPSPVTSVCLYRELAAAAFASGKCCLMGPGQPQPIAWIAHAGAANCIQFHPDGSYIASCGEDATIRFWEIPEPTMFGEFKGHEKGVTSLRFSQDGTCILSGSRDHSIKFWDLCSGHMVRDLRGQNSIVIDAHFAGLENCAISLAADSSLKGFSLHSARVSYQSDTTRNERYRGLAADPHRPLVVTAGADGYLVLWEMARAGSSLQAKSATPTQAPPDAKSDYEADPLIGQKLGPYIIERPIGAGGMGTVYLAHHNDQKVAIKVIRPDRTTGEFQIRFEREIELSMKLNHPNVVRTVDWGREANYTYLVMEIIDGLPLKEHIPATGIALKDATACLAGIVAGLEYAHSLGIVHRDIKPENVMLTSDGHLKLMDFGLARDRTVKTVTRLGSSVGTAAYMAPEQVMRGPERSELTEHSDQYALGVLIFELLTGHCPFQWDDPIKLISMHLTQEPPALTSVRPDLPVALDLVLAKMLSKDVDERYPSVRAAYIDFVKAATT